MYPLETAEHALSLDKNFCGVLPAASLSISQGGDSSPGSVTSSKRVRSEDTLVPLGGVGGPAPLSPIKGGYPARLQRSEPAGLHASERTADQQSTDFSRSTILDIPTPLVGHLDYSGGYPPTPLVGQIGVQFGQEISENKRVLSKSSRRLYSRVLMGLRLPGRYYFITWTSGPDSPPIKKSWPTLKKWLHRYRPGAAWVYAITKEGNPVKIKNLGVIHMVIRLGHGEQRLDAVHVRAHWEGLHKAKQVYLQHVPESAKDDLSAYLADQRKQRKLGAEMAWQDQLVRWRWSAGWLPKGFTKAFGRVWVRLQDVSPGQREKAITDWLNACQIDDNNIFIGPSVKEGEVYKFPYLGTGPAGPTPERKRPGADFDKLLKAGVERLNIENTVEIDDLSPETQVTLTRWKTKYDARNIRERFRL